MSTHNIGFYEDLTKVIFQLSNIIKYAPYLFSACLQIQNLYQFVGSMKEMVHTDPYKLSSVISLLDLGVGHGINLTATDRVS